MLAGRVDRLLDGDTFDVLLDGDDETTRIRMQGIDAPETDQPMSDDAVAMLERLLGDAEVQLQPAGQTSYNRIVARVYVDGVDVNAQMVRRGLAMAERRYLREFDDGADYCVFEHAARSDKLGIWRLPPNQRIPPWYAPSRGGPRGPFTDTATRRSRVVSQRSASRSEAPDRVRDSRRSTSHPLSSGAAQCRRRAGRCKAVKRPGFTCGNVGRRSMGMATACRARRFVVNQGCPDSAVLTERRAELRSLLSQNGQDKQTKAST